MSTDNASRTVTSNTAFYYVCYRLSALGWHVEPSAPKPANRTLSLQYQGSSLLSVKVKAINGKAAAGFGTGTLKLPFDYVVVVDVSGSSEPTSYILSTQEVRQRINTNTKDGTRSFWLEFSDYRQPEFEEQWDKLGIAFANG